jgi:hypothetical protein
MFEASAFMLLAVAAMARIAPLYGEVSERLCQLEVGRMFQLLEMRVDPPDRLVSGVSTSADSRPRSRWARVRCTCTRSREGRQTGRVEIEVGLF